MGMGGEGVANMRVDDFLYPKKCPSHVHRKLRKKLNVNVVEWVIGEDIRK